MANLTISFDDIVLTEGAETRINNGYAGFNWNQAGVYNPDGTLPGYGASSGQNLAFIAEAGGQEIAGYEDAAAGSPFVMTRERPFDLLSADFSAAFRNDLPITIRVYADEAGTQLIGTTTVTAQQGTAQTIDLDESVLTGIRRVEFSANDGDVNTLDYFGIDNIVVRDTLPPTTTLTFDDLPLAEGGEARIANGYAGFNWTQAGVYNPDGAIAGYGASSGENLAFIAEAGNQEIAGYDDVAAGTPFVMTRSTGFNLLSADFSAAFRDNLAITVTAYADEAGTQVIASQTVTAQRGTAQTTAFDEALFTGAKRLEFNANDGDASTLDYFGLDNLVVRDTGYAPPSDPGLMG